MKLIIPLLVVAIINHVVSNPSCNVICEDEIDGQPVKISSALSSILHIQRGKTGSEGESSDTCGCQSELNEVRLELQRLQKKLKGCNRPVVPPSAILSSDKENYQASEQISFGCPGNAEPSGESSYICSEGNFEPQINFRCGLTYAGKTSCKNQADGKHTISYDNGITEFDVFCKDEKILIMARLWAHSDYEVNFEEYEKGFGNEENRFWLGLKRIHGLTRSGRWRLFVSLRGYGYKPRYKHVNYEDFRIGKGPEYRLNVGQLSKDQPAVFSSAGDSLSSSNGAAFSAMNNNQQDDKTIDCVVKHDGAGWFPDDCGQVNIFTHTMEWTKEMSLHWQTFNANDKYEDLKHVILYIKEIDE